jgi:hypothetical protein
MKRGVILLTLTCAAAFAQDQPVPEAWQLQALKNALRVSPKPRIVLSQAPRACAVPLLPVPVDPRIGAKMPVAKPPVQNMDDMPRANGLPPCPLAAR